MTEFKELQLTDMETLRPYFEKYGNGINDNTLGTVMMWRKVSFTEFVIVNNTLIRKMRYFNGENVFSIPLGEDVEGGLRWTKDYCAKHNLPFIVAFVRKEDKELISSMFETETVQETDWGDYIYNISDLAEMKGKKYNTQRNHINAFKRDYSDWYTEPLNERNVEQACEFLTYYSKTKSKEAQSYQRAEIKMVHEVLEHLDLYKMRGICLYAKGRIVGFTIGEITADTLFVHIEKADALVRGAYPMLVTEFTKQNLGKASLVNREEDMGDLGLRKSKLKYRPIEIIPKFTVRII